MENFYFLHLYAKIGRRTISRSREITVSGFDCLSLLAVLESEKGLFGLNAAFRLSNGFVAPRGAW